MAPPPADEKPAFDFKAKGCMAKPKLDKAESSDDRDHDRKKNRIVLVWSLTVGTKVKDRSRLDQL